MATVLKERSAQTLHRLCKEEDLAVKRRKGRKRATGIRATIELPSKPFERWSLDFVSDVFEQANGCGRRFRMLCVSDDCTRENLALVADTSLSGERVSRELDRLVRLYGKPQTIVSEFEGQENDPVNYFP